MLSRLSSFSGPLSKLFTSLKGFTLNGLILRYELKDNDSYTGTNTVTDLVSNSSATLINGPTFSSNGYLNFDGINDYLMTNTSLNSKLSPVNTSTVISFFVWVYPTDNGVIVNEQGSTTLDFSWFDSQLEIVSGSLKFRVWPGSALTSTIPISFNKWYYLGLTYDGTTMRGYVNGQFAGSYNISRQTPYNNGAGKGLHYALASSAGTNLGDGTNSKLKLGAFHVYNTALSQQQVLNNYNSTKSDYIYSENMLIWIDANDPQSFSGGNILDISGNGYTHLFGGGATSAVVNGIKCFDCSTPNATIYTASGPTLSSTGYTYVTWAKLITSNTQYRTLYRTSPNDHPLLIQINTDNLGFWDNNDLISAFQDSGYDVTNYEGVWAQWSVVGDSSGSTFYINDNLVGTTTKSAHGNFHNFIGNTGINGGQPFGHIGNTILYNTKLTQEQIKQNYDALKHVYNPQIITDGLLLRLDANNSSSYSGSGATWSDISGGGNNMTLRNSPTFVSGSISYFDFNGTTQYAQGTGLTVPSTAYTKSVWFWVDAYVANNIVSGYNGIGGHFLFMGNTTKILVGHHNQGVVFGTYQSTATISLNTWYNVTVTFNTSQGFRIYINGQLDSSHNMTLAHLGSGTTNLASYGNTGDNFLNGRISKVYTYNRVLTAAEVLQNFNADRTEFGI